MNPFLNAVQQGYSPEEVLKFIAKAMPKFSQPIRQASSMGYNAKQIVGFLSKSMAPRNLRGKSESEIHEMNRMEDAQRVKNGLTMAASAVAAPIAASAARSALSRALPSNLTNLAAGMNPTAAPANMTGQPQSPSPSVPPSSPTSPQPQAMQQPQTAQSGLSSSSQQPPIGSNVTSVTQPQQSMQPKGISIIPDQVRQESDALWARLQKGVVNHPDKDVKALLKIANDMFKYQGLKREDFDKLYDEFIQKKQTGVPLDQIAKDMFAIGGKTEGKLPHSVPKEKPEDDKLGFKAAFRTLSDGTISNKLYEGIFDALKQGKDTYAGVKEPLLQAAKPAFDAGQIKSVDDLKKFADFYEKSKQQKSIAKNEIVVTPHGVGEVKEIRNGQALIDVDGKLHKVKEDELEGSPLPEKDLAELYDDLIKGIESETEEDVSRMVQWAGYNPEENTLTFLPHTGKLYKYADISPEDAALLTDILSTRKTSGENFMGAWKAGSKSPIGAALSKLIRKLQSERGGKGNEYEETHEPIYSAYEPAVQAAKKKNKKKL